MKGRNKSVVIFVSLLLLLFVTAPVTAAGSSILLLENEQHWETYGVGGTCISGSGSNVFLADVDGDGETEIITGGRTYDVVNGVATENSAPLKVWNWNGATLTLQASQKWLGIIHCLFAADANGDGKTEIVTGATITNSTGNFMQLKIWSANDKALVLSATKELAYGRDGRVVALYVDDSKQTPEIVTFGWFVNGSQTIRQIIVWHSDGNSLDIIKTSEWVVANDTQVVHSSQAGSMYMYDLDSDGLKEIITASYANDLKNSSGQLRIWHWNGQDLTLQVNQEWQGHEGYGLTIAGNVQGNTVANKVKVGDVDNDGTPEIITGGFTYDGDKILGQLRIWNWNGQKLNLEKSHEWSTQDLVEVRGISIDDVDGDGVKEILTSGGSGAAGSFASNATAPEMAQLRIWSWDGTTLTLEEGKDWYIDDGAMAQNVATGDIDKDGTMEIVTVGCTYLTTLCDPDMRIWSISNNLSTSPWILSAAIGAITAAVLGITFLLIRKKRLR